MRASLIALTAAVALGIGAWAQTNPAPVRVALVSSCEDETSALALALATTELSQGQTIALVERSEIERVLREHSLQRCGASDAQQALAVGRLLGAEVFVAVESFGHTAGLPGIVAFDARTGVRFWDAALTTTNTQPLAAEIAAVVRSACAKRAHLGTEARTACVLAVRNAGLPREMNSACDAAGRLLEQQLLGSPDLAVLERHRLEQINRERSLPGLGGSNELQLSLTLIEVEISRPANGVGLLGTAFLTDAAGQVIGKVSTNIVNIAPAELAEALMPQLLAALKSAPPTIQPDRRREALRFLSESQFLQGDGDIPGALRLAEAASALDGDSESVQLQLAHCLAVRAIGIFTQGGNDVKNSLPLAMRAAGIGRELRSRAAAANRLPDRGLTSVEDLLVWCGPVQPKHRYWENVQARFSAQDAETRDELLDFQRQLRELKSQLVIVPYRKLIPQGASADDYGERVCNALQDAGKFTSAPEVWMSDMELMMTNWMAVMEDYPISWGGWTLSHVRFQAWLACQAGGTKMSENPQPTSSPPGGEVPRMFNAKLGPQELARFGALFARMLRHTNTTIQCYGRIGQFALTLRGQTGINEGMIRDYESAREFIRGKIVIVAAEGDIARRRHTYCAARDLIDLVPDAEFRRREHRELFEFMLARRELSYWTVHVAVHPDAVRFAQYNLYGGGPFPGEPIGYPVEQYPLLLDNAQRTRVLFTSTNCSDVDATKFTFQTGSFERQLDAMCRAIYTKRPDLEAKTSAGLPWVKAEKLYQGQNGGIHALLPDGDGQSNAFIAVVSDRRNGQHVLEAIRLPVNGSTATFPLLTTNSVPPISGVCLWEDRLYYGVGGQGVYSVSMRDGSARLINHESGLLSDNFGAFTVMDGKLYTLLAEGQLVALDLNSNRCDILASKRAKEKRSALEEVETGFNIRQMLPDPARRRVLFTTEFKGDLKHCFPLIGLWQIDADTGLIKQLLATHYPIPSMERDLGENLLLFCPRNGMASGPCHPPFYSLLSFDLTSDTARVIWTFNLKDYPVGPGLIADERTIRREIVTHGPFVIGNDWLWLSCNGQLRLSLKSGDLQEYVLPAEMAPPSDKNGWQALKPLANGKQILAASRNSIWRLTLPEKESKDLPR